MSGEEQIARSIRKPPSLTMHAGGRMAHRRAVNRDQGASAGFTLLDVHDLDTVWNGQARCRSYDTAPVEIRPVLEGQAWRKPWSSHRRLERELQG